MSRNSSDARTFLARKGLSFRRSKSQESSEHHESLRKEVVNAFQQAGALVKASLRPLPTETGDGSYLATEPTQTGALSDMEHMKARDYMTLVEAFVNSQSGEPADDRDYLMEKLIGLAADLPSSSAFGIQTTSKLLNQLWNDLQHPPWA